MIQRILVPLDVSPVKPGEAKNVGTRVTTYMDDRTVVPSGPSNAPPLNGKSNIPQYMPLGVLVQRTPKGSAYLRDVHKIIGESVNPKKSSAKEGRRAAA